MNSSACLTVSIAVVVLLSAINSPLPAQSIGPDLTVSGLADQVVHWDDSGGIAAYSFAMDFCNSGDADVLWEAIGDHPVHVQNLYRIIDGRFDQIGMSWVRHGFCALSLSGCGTCAPSDCSVLSIGCRTTNSASSSGSASGYAPRSDVDPSTGQYAYPPTLTPTGGALAGRIRVPLDAIDPSLYPGAVYIAELQAIAADDTAAGNGMNNVSWREVEFTGSSATASGGTMTSSTAVEAWALIDPTVEVAMIDVPGDGRLLFASRASGSPGNWRYQYVLYNMNSRRGARALTVGAAIDATAAEFSGIAHHSGEPYANEDWLIDTVAGIDFACPTYATDPYANALRWGTAFRFAFTSALAPSAGAIDIALFGPGAPGEPDSLTITATVPGAIDAPFVRGDVNDDGVLDISDPTFTLAALFVPGAPATTCEDGGDGNDDGTIDLADAVYLLAGLFIVGSPPPPLPYPSCGADPSSDTLDCAVYAGCP